MQYEEIISSGLEVPFTRSLPINMDQSELDGLFASCMPKLARAARQMMRNAQDSEDVLQDGLLSAFQNLHQFQGRSKFSTWLHSIVINKAKMHLRKLNSYQRHVVEQDSPEHSNFVLENATDPSPDAEQTCAENERSRILRSMLTQLPPAYRSVIQLCDIEGLNGEDAAAALGMSRSSLKTCLHRARRLISKKIRQSCRPVRRSSRGRVQTNLAQGRPARFGAPEKWSASQRNRLILGHGVRSESAKSIGSLEAHHQPNKRKRQIRCASVPVTGRAAVVSGLSRAAY